MLLAWSSASVCNHYTETVNLPVHAPRIFGVGTASLAGTICFRISQNCIELAQNWNRPRKELYGAYKGIWTCKESTVPKLMIAQHFAVVHICPPSHWAHSAGLYLRAVNQVSYSLVPAVPASVLTGTRYKDLSSLRWSWTAVLGDSPLSSAQLRRGSLGGCKDHH